MEKFYPIRNTQIQKAASLKKLLTVRLRSAFLCIALLLLGVASVQAQSAYLQSATAEQITGSIFPGQAQAKVLRVRLQVTGPATTTVPLRYFTFRWQGSATTADASNVRLFYSGTTDGTYIPMRPGDSISPSSYSISSGSLQFRTSRSLAVGTHFFFLVANVASTATLTRTLDASLDSLFINDTLFSLAQNPTGSRTIDVYNNYAYCPLTVTTPNSQVNALIGMTQVIIGDSINNSSADLDRLSIYNQRANVYRQETVPVTIRFGSGNNEQIVGWVDWNLDGLFDLNTEQVFYSAVSGAGASYNTSFNVPCVSKPGLYKLRIASDFFAVAKIGPCGTLTYGDAEEYWLNVKSDYIPIAKFNVDTGQYVGSPVEFNNQSTAKGNVIYEWDFNNDGVYEFTGKNGTATFNTAGKRRVTLRVSLLGCDSTIRRTYSDSVTVINPVRVPISNFLADRNLVSVFDVVQLIDISQYKPGQWLWEVNPSTNGGVPTFGYRNGTSSLSKNPAIQFNTPGKYTVSLTTWNALGKGSKVVKTSYITVANAVNLCSGGANVTDTIRSAEGVLFDDGGKNNVYASAPVGTVKTCRMAIKPGCASQIVLRFHKFNLSTLVTTTSPSGNRGDVIRVWDGTGTNGRSLHDSAGFPNGFTGGVLPPQLIAHSGALYIEFSVNDGFVADGIEATWEATLYPVPSPVAELVGPDSVWVSQFFVTSSATKGQGNTYSWELDGDGIDDATGSSVNWVFFQSGWQSIRFVASNCGGSDTLIKRIYVKEPTKAPTTEFEASSLRVYSGDRIELTDKSGEGPQFWQWTITPSKVNFLQGGAGAQNPVVQLTDTGLFSVSLEAGNTIGSKKITKLNYIRSISGCAPTVTATNQGIAASKVELLDIGAGSLLDHVATTATSGYANYSADVKTPIVYHGGRYNLRITRPNTFNAVDIIAFIDLDGNGDFTAGNERIYTWSNSTLSIVQDTILIPSTGTIVGHARMRIIILPAGATASACGTMAIADVRDYVLNILPDAVLPEITLNGLDTTLLEFYRPYTELGAKAYDNVDGDISYKIIRSGRPDSNLFKFQFVTYRVEDKAGNMAVKVRVIKMIPDTSAPILTLNGPDTVKLGAMLRYKDLGVKSSDHTDPFDIIKPEMIVRPDSSVLGYQVAIWSATDDFGNTGYKNRVVEVVDTIAPTFTLKGLDTFKLQYNSRYIEPGWNLSDNYWTNLKPVITGGYDSIKTGYYKLYYQVTDGSGNATEVLTRVIWVRDFIKPIVYSDIDTLVWDVKRPFVNVNEIYYSDNLYVGNQLQLKYDGVLDVNALGYYPIKIYAQDDAGNVSDTLNMVVWVVDRIAPGIALLGDEIVRLNRWAEWEDPEVAYSDNFDKNVTIQIGGDYVSADKPGVFFRTYQAFDNTGNRSIKLTRFIQVFDTLTSLADAKTGAGIPLNVYPNPSTSAFQIRSRTELSQVQIVDISGRSILQIIDPRAKMANGELQYEVTWPSDTKPGVYLLQVRDSRGVIGTERLMKAN